MNILYMVFGEEQRNHIQAYFSMCSFLNQMDASDRIFILTDAPKYYQRIAEKVTIIETPKTQLKQWEGEYGFFWRVKIKALEYICQQYPTQELLYLDTDTFLFSSLKTLKIALKNPVMHLNEGKLSELKSKTERLMWQQVGAKTVGNITIQAHHCMWNAGVVGLPAGQGLGIVEKALALCDDMLALGVTRRLIEQFALSVACADFGQLQPAEPIIGHYWANKSGWNEAIQRFMADTFLGKRSVSEDIEVVGHFDFKKIAIQQRIPNTQTRLKKIIERWFPAENEQFIQ